ncbi:MAG: hypothetical protein AB7V16_09535 [Vulcanibacillus sp.]
MYPEEYQEFSLLIKKYVVLKVLINVLDYDRNALKNSGCKLLRIYDDNLVEIQWQIEDNLRQLKKECMVLGGSIIEEFQETDVRIVKVKFKNYIYTHRYLNYVLQTECEKTLKLLLNGNVNL